MIRISVIVRHEVPQGGQKGPSQFWGLKSEANKPLESSITMIFAGKAKTQFVLMIRSILVYVVFLPNLHLAPVVFREIVCVQ